MTPASRSAATVAYDIEVVGYDWNELDEATRGYLLERGRKKGQPPEEVQQKTALTLGLGHVVAISFWNLHEQRGGVLLEGESSDWAPWPGRSDGAFLFRGSERELLTAFWQKVKTYGRLVSFHGRGFDGPVLMLRSAVLGVSPTRNLAGKPWDWKNHCDLADVFTFHGAVRAHISLDYWCPRFGGESTRGVLDGSQVDRAYTAGEVERIADYCLRGARATSELYQRVAPTLLPTLE